MTDEPNFEHLNDFPKRSKTHDVESIAQASFENFIGECRDVFIQKADRKDYGTDYQLEVIADGKATNVRVHAQLKGTQKSANPDSSVSVEIDRANLNYLLMYPYSFYACFHIPSSRLLVCSAEEVARSYQHGLKNWTQQATLTVSFSQQLTQERIRTLASLSRLDAISSRNERYKQFTARPEVIAASALDISPVLHVPEERSRAIELLLALYEGNREELISSTFEKFAFSLGSDHEAMQFCYMAEINLGMSNRPFSKERVSNGINHFSSLLGFGVYSDGSLNYCIGNAYSALGSHEQAILSYERALTQLYNSDDDELTAECYKNMGASLAATGNIIRAVGSYQKALNLRPQLAEAHHALGHHYHREGRFEEALQHFDNVVFTDGRSIKQLSVSGWRVNIHFNLGDGRSAFREINNLLSQAASEDWVWPWCARQVAEFGCTSAENAKLSIGFWDRYAKAFPNEFHGKYNRCLAVLFLRLNGHDIGISYGELKVEFESCIENMGDMAGAYAWDRLGHWAQEEGDWEEAGRCFRKAYNLAGGEYGYCLAVALNVLNRCDESLQLLKDQAESIQPDDMSWYQLAVAYEKVGQIPECIRAYRKAITLNRDYDLAWFNLGGVYWNNGHPTEARRIWKKAIGLFPDHELAEVIRRNFLRATS